MYALSGLILGALVGILATCGLTWIVVSSNPDDPSAGSIATVIIVFLPIGAILGLIVGWLTGRYKSKHKVKKED